MKSKNISPTLIAIHVHGLPGLDSLRKRADQMQTALGCLFSRVELAKGYRISTRDVVNKDSIEWGLCLHDPLLETTKFPHQEVPDVVMEIGWLPGVTDNSGKAAADALRMAGKFRDDALEVRSSEVIYGWLAVEAKSIADSGELSDFYGTSMGRSFTNRIGSILEWSGFYNPLVQYLSFPGDNPASFIASTAPLETRIKVFPLESGIESWLEASERSCWALTRDEIEQVLDFFRRPDVQVYRHKSGLPAGPTDVEMEIIAQSWSEHCKHKIFAAEISYREEIDSPDGGFKVIPPQKFNGLFKSEIVRATKEIEENRKLDWLSSTFSDNAGMVRFDKNIDISIKVETHNSPSALDPYGGALTGILGVNRDILGTGMGARPVANTDVLCFGEPGWSVEEARDQLPEGLKHPDRVLDGVHRGIQDGGNKSGIPVVNGAFVFDDQYCGKPLVYCGTVGVSPATLPDGRDGSKKHLKVGDFVVMAGGRVGKDGIHGATFSSLELNEVSPSSAVQIGDPLTQKRLLDFVIEARDAGLYSGITDNGAGGLSSSVGEMAQHTGGATIDVARVPLKYPGLLPWEIVVSESQERMTIAVPPDRWDAFEKLATIHSVEVTRLGVFDDNGSFRIRWDDRLVASLSLDFLHKELRPMQLEAIWSGPQQKPVWIERKPAAWRSGTLSVARSPSMAEALQATLMRPNVQSKEKFVRRFDHEVQAATVGKPFNGVKSDGPADGGVIWLKPHGADDPWAGVAVSSGINSKVAHFDTWISALLSMDEAVRNGVASGGDPDMMCLVDNFCWPDPIPNDSNTDAAHKLGQLVRACRALSFTAISWGMPFISGKDSMKNDFSGVTRSGRRVKISVPPTVLVTALSRVPDVRRLCGSDFKSGESNLYLVGPDAAWPLAGSEYASVYGEETPPPVYPLFDLKQQLEIYRAIHRAMMDGLFLSCHDVSDGGVAAAVCESSIGGRVGCVLDGPKDHSWWFHEGPGRFVVSVSQDKSAKFESIFCHMPVRRIGIARSDLQTIQFFDKSEILLRCELDLVKSWWKGEA